MTDRRLGSRIRRAAFVAAFAAAVVPTADAAVTMARAAPTSALVSVPPARLLDSRPGATTIDGVAAGTGLVGSGSTLELAVAGRAGIPANAASVVLNITVTEPQAAGFITAYPCGTTRPNASSLNFVTSETVPNMVISALSGNGKICLFASQATHLLADVSGYFVGTAALTPLPNPARLLDSRPGATTIDGGFAGTALVGPTSTIGLFVSGRAGVPLGVSSVVLNVTVTDARGTGFMTVYPCDQARPNASNLNFGRGQTVPNAVISALSADGKVCLFSSQPAHVIVDVSSYVPGTTMVSPPCNLNAVVANAAALPQSYEWETEVVCRGEWAVAVADLPDTFAQIRSLFDYVNGRWVRVQTIAGVAPTPDLASGTALGRTNFSLLFGDEGWPGRASTPDQIANFIFGTYQKETGTIADGLASMWLSGDSLTNWLDYRVYHASTFTRQACIDIPTYYWACSADNFSETPLIFSLNISYDLATVTDQYICCD